MIPWTVSFKIDLCRALLIVFLSWCKLLLTYFLGGSRGRGRGGGPNNRLKFDSEFDFETSNQQFNKEDIERELKEKLTISSSPAAGQYFSIYTVPSFGIHSPLLVIELTGRKNVAWNFERTNIGLKIHIYKSHAFILHVDIMLLSINSNMTALYARTYVIREFTPWGVM